MRYIIDRFEGNYAVCRGDGENKDILIKDLPVGVKECDTIIFDGKSYRIDKEDRERRQKEFNDIFEKIKEQDK